VKERPILFSAPMVRAILAGTKTQTRRVVKFKPWYQIEERDDGTQWPWMYDSENDGDCWIPSPYGQPGDRLWVRETWAAPHGEDGRPPRAIQCDQMRIHYAASEDRGGLLWRPSIHMPRWASRITLEVTGLRVERLQDISEEDALAEGIDKNEANRTLSCIGLNVISGPVAEYSALWESINGPDSWEFNPWVWVIQFKKL